MTQQPAQRSDSRQAPPRLGVVARPQLPPRMLVDTVRRADAAGLDDVWLWEDCFLEGGVSSATAALAASESVRVGLGLMPVPMRNPAVAAMEMATIAELFPDRFAPAVGHGVQDWMAQVGAKVESPMTLLREWMTAVCALLAGDTVSTRGRYVRLEGVALDWPPAAVPPVMIGGRGPRTLALAGELAAGSIIDSANTPADVRTAVGHIAPGPGHDVVVYVMASADDAGAERHQAALPSASTGSIVVGDATRVASRVMEYADAGATTVVLLTTGENPDMPGFIEFTAEVRAALHAA